jgi:DNA invertase Pin-like site-specific DNA recombinase
VEAATIKDKLTEDQLAAMFRHASGYETMPAGWTPVGAWIRVSSGAQDEANQVPSVTRYCIGRKLWPARWYVVHDKSAFKGEQDKALAEMLNDARRGKFQRLVCWHSDRLERRGVKALFSLIRLVREAGADVKSVQEPELGAEGISGDALTALSAAASHQESVKKSERERLAVERVRGNGALWGNGHWGYAIVGEKYNKTLEPTDEGREYVPQIFRRVADGQSCHKVGDWMRAGPRPGMSDKTVYRMIRDRIYMGVKMVDGLPAMKVPPLVDAKLWTDANDRLSARRRGSRGPKSGKPAFLTSTLFCGRCPRDGEWAPMYRINAGNRRKDGTKTSYHYYRCRGHAPELKSCGNMVRLEVFDFMADHYLRNSPSPWTELRKIHGENHDTELAEIRLELADLPKRGLADEAEDKERIRLRAERDRISALPKTPDHWDEVPFCADCGGIVYAAECEAAAHRKVTVGEHWSSLDYEGQRQMMIAEVKFYVHRPPTGLPTLQPVSRLFGLEAVELINSPGAEPTDILG